MAILDKSWQIPSNSGVTGKSDLTSINVSLPRSLREFAEAEAGRVGCTTTSEYVRRLIAADRKIRADDDLEKLLIEGLDSGDAVELTREWFDDLRARIRRRG